LDYLAEGSLNRIDEIQKISHQLLPENGLHVNEARVLIAVLIESVCLDKTKNNSFGEIYRILSGNDLNNYLESIIARFSDKLGYFCLLNINAFLGKTRENREFIQNLASSALELWADPQIDRTTSSSSFNLANFAREKSTLYVVVHPIDIERLRPLLQIFYQQFISIWVTTNQRSENNSSSRANAMLMILDEFESLGRIKSMESIVFYSRGYRLKICPIVHNIDELENVYGYEGACSLLSGCGTRVACCTNNSNTSALIAELVGSKIIPDDNGSRITVPLLLPQELTRLPKEKVIVASDSVAIECDKSLYYEDPTFRDRLLIATHIPSLEI
jgi:type IV secretion system protein VirD4